MVRPRPEKQRRQYGLRLNLHLMRDVEHLAVDEQRGVNELVEEAVRDLLKKYKEKRKDMRAG